MRVRELTAIGTIALLGMSGCATMQERQWGRCAVAGGMLGAAVGGGLAAPLVNEYEGGDGSPSSWELGAAAAGGVVGGAVLGSVLGHFICDPEVERPAPLPLPPPPPAPRKIELRSPFFDLDGDQLRPTGVEKVREAAQGLQEDPKLRVSVEGHTDSLGSEAYNQKLSERRAESVRDALIAEGVAPSRITTVGFGEMKPVVSNSTDEGRQQNRRVDMILQH
jgi:OOP family OmpA-OmpF porin